MKPLSFFSRSLLYAAAVCSLSLSTQSLAAPADQPSVNQTRQPGQQELSGTLTENQYVLQDFQREYTVQVPYEVQESYQDQEPYQVEEAYTDYEYYQDREYRCHRRTERVCNYRPICRNEQGPPVCREERRCSRPKPKCYTRQECFIDGKGNKVCEDRLVCDEGSETCDTQRICEPGRSERVCKDEYFCDNVEREECGYETVQKSRPVTRYRTVTRYREVTKYRTVTRYRTETRCCETVTESVYSHQLSLQYLVRFPQAATLLPGEKEVFKISTFAKATDVEVRALQSIYGYKVASKSKNGSQVVVDLELIPRFTPAQAGVGTVAATLAMAAESSSVVITDQIVHPRVSTQYEVSVYRLDGVLVAQASSAASANGITTLVLPQKLDQWTDYRVEVKFVRSGSVLDPQQKYEFVAQSEYKFKRLSAADFGSKTLRLGDISEKSGQATLTFQDLGADPRLQTVYLAQLIGDQDKKVYAQVEVNAAGVLDTNKQGQVVLDIRQISEAQNYTIVVKVQRTSALLDQAVSFEQKKAYVRFLDEKIFSTKEALQDFQLRGLQESARLIFKDAGVHPAVQNTYSLAMMTENRVGARGPRVTLSAQFTQADLVALDSGYYAVNLAKVSGLRVEDLKRYMRLGTTFQISIEAQRKSPRLNDGKVLKVERSLRARVQR